MTEITLKYIPFSDKAGFLQIKQTEVHGYSYYLTVFYVHVYSSIFLLLAGFSQFSNYLLAKMRWLHQIIGRIYVFGILVFSAPTGFVMGLHANGGLVSKIAFCVLAILWFTFTFIAILQIKKGNREAHRRWMYRSFALTLSAITLRIWKVIIAHTMGLPPMDIYQIISWLGWVPNLFIIELYLFKIKKV